MVVEKETKGETITSWSTIVLLLWPRELKKVREAVQGCFRICRVSHVFHMALQYQTMGVIICKNFILFLERLDQIKSACQQTGRTLPFCLLTHTVHFVPELTFRPLRSACGHCQQSSSKFFFCLVWRLIMDEILFQSKIPKHKTFSLTMKVEEIS
jgi:hypothetical protein